MVVHYAVYIRPMPGRFDLAARGAAGPGSFFPADSCEEDNRRYGLRLEGQTQALRDGSRRGRGQEHQEGKSLRRRCRTGPDHAPVNAPPPNLLPG